METWAGSPLAETLMAWCLYPLSRQTVVALPAVRAHLRAGFDCGRDKGNQAGAGDIVDPPQAYTAEALGRQYFDGNSDDELVLCAASTHALFDADRKRVASGKTA